MSDAEPEPRAEPTSASPPFSLKGRVAVVTGAGRGLGFEMAMALARAGARVVITGRSEAGLAGAVAKAAADGAALDVSAFDMADLDAGRVALEGVVARHGRLDILINNVGMRDRRPLSAFTASEARALYDANLLGPMMLARAAAEVMARQGHGRLIFVTSIAALAAFPDDPLYSSVKAGLGGLTRQLAVDYARLGVTVNAIAPGMFATESNAGLAGNDEFMAFARMRVPLGRLGRPHEIAAAAVFLASDEASFVNGHTLVVDGGQTVRM